MPCFMGMSSISLCRSVRTGPRRRRKPLGPHAQHFPKAENLGFYDETPSVSSPVTTQAPDARKARKRAFRKAADSIPNTRRCRSNNPREVQGSGGTGSAGPLAAAPRGRGARGTVGLPLSASTHHVEEVEVGLAGLHLVEHE